MSDTLEPLNPGTERPSSHARPFLTVHSGPSPHPSRAVFAAPKFPASTAQLQRAARWLDVGALLLATTLWLFMHGTPLAQMPLQRALPWIAPAILGPLAISWAGGYCFTFVKPVRQHLQTVALASAFMFAAIGLVTGALQGEEAGRHFAGLALISTLLLVGLHGHYISLIKHLTRTGRLSQNVVIVGATQNARRLIEQNALTRELNIVGIFDDRLARAPLTMAGAPLLGKLDDLFAWDRLPEIDRIIVTVTSDARARVRYLIDQLRMLPNQVVLLLDLEGFDPESESLARIAHSPAAYVSGQPEDVRKATLKRLTDLIFATYLLLALAPLMALIGATLKLRTGGQAFSHKPRYGFNNHVFYIWAFQTPANAPRLSKFLQHSGLYAIPQLFNVLAGDMSIVGPEAHITAEAKDSQSPHAMIADYAHRHRVKPGITGWAQIHQTTQEDAFAERVHRDMEYINRTSFWFDLYIMFKTAQRLIIPAQR